MERQSFWWRTRAAELLSDLAASSFLGLRGFAMAIWECGACVSGCFFLLRLEGGIYKGNEGTHGLSLDFRAHLIGDVP